MNWRRWPWLEEVALPIAVLGIGVIWLWPWVTVLSRWLLPPEQRPILPLWTIILLLAGGAILARVITVDPQRPWRAQSLAISVGILAILLTVWWRLSSAEYALWDLRWLAVHGYIVTHWNGVIPATVLVAGLTAYLWLRGMKDSDAPNHDDVLRAFGIGFAAIVLLLIVGRIDPAGLSPTIIRWIVLYFGVGMLALAMAGLRMARGTRNPSASLPVNRYWAASIIVLIVMLLSIGLLLGLLVTPDAIARVTSWFDFVANIITQLLIWVLYALVYLVFLVLTPLIHWVENRLGLNLTFDTERLGDMGKNAMDNNENPAPIALPPAVEESMRWLVFLGVALVIALAFAGALRYLRKRNEDDEDEMRETVLSSELLLDQARSLWERWRDRWQGNARDAYSPYFALRGVEANRQRIRLAYQLFLDKMAEQGFARRRRQTPYRYADFLSQNDIADPESLQALTNAYIAARYGDATPTLDDVTTAEDAWSSIQRAFPEQSPP